MEVEKKTYLVNIESNLKKYSDEAAEAKKKVDELKKVNDDLVKSGQASASEIEKSNAALRTAQKEYSNAKKSVDQATMANKAQAGSYEQLYRQWQNAQTQLKLMGGAYTTNAQGVRVLSEKYIEQKKAVEDAKRSLDSFGKGVADNRLNVGNYSEAIEGAVGNMRMMPGVLGTAAGGIQKMTLAAKAFIATPIGAVIAAIGVAIGALTSYFKRSEEGQNALTKVTAAFSSILQNVLDVVDKVGKALFKLFTEPKEAIKSLGDFIKENINNRIEALRDIGAAVRKIFSKDWKEGFKELGESTVQLATGVDDYFGKMVDAARNFGKELKDDAAAAKRLADQMADIRKRERFELVEDAQIRKEAAALRAEAEKMKFIDAEKSISLIQRAFEIERKVLRDDLEIAQAKRDIAKEQASLSNSTIETLDEVARLEADVYIKQAAFDEARRMELRNMNKLKKEAFNQEKEQLTALLEIERAQAEAVIFANEKISKNDTYTYDQRVQALQDNLTIRTELLQKQSELELRSLEKDFELEMISQENFEIKKLAIQEKYKGEQMKIVATTVDETKTVMDELIDYENNRYLTDQKNRLEIRKLVGRDEFDLQREALDQQYEAEMIAAEKTGADVMLIKEKYTIAQSKIDQAEVENKLMLYSGFAGNLATIFGKNTAIGKAAAVAQAVIDTYLSATKAFTAMADIPVVGPVLGVAAAGAAVAMGIANVKKILAVKSGLPGDTGGGSVPTAISSSAPAQRSYAAPTGSTILSTTNLSQTQLNALPNQNLLTAQDIADAISKLPNPIVTVEDLNAKVASVNKVAVRANI